MPFKGLHLQYERIWGQIFGFGGRPPQINFFLTLIYKKLENKIFLKFFEEVEIEVIFHLCKFKKIL